MVGIKFSHYGELREVNATDEELKMFEALKHVPGLEEIELVRKSDSYVTAIIGEWDIARFKYTQRAKWISFPLAEFGKNSTKHRIQAPEQAADFPDQIQESIRIVNKYR